MPLGDKLIGIGVGIVVCAIFAVVVMFFAKKEKAKTEERLNSLSEEQKEYLKNAPVQDANGRDGGVIVKGLVHEIPKVGKSKASLAILFYNTYFPNSLNQFQGADISISVKDMEEHNIKPGDYVNLLINANGGKVIF